MGRNNHAIVAGLFILILAVATSVIIYWIGHFDRERNLYVVSTRASVSGLNPESTVFFRGISVGKVLNVEFDPNDSGIILVPIEVDKNIVLTKGVYATLRLKGVTGLTQIQLEDSNTLPTPLIPGYDPNERIPLVPSMTDKLLDTGEVLLQKADHLMQRLSALLTDENQKNIGSILTNLKSLSDKLIALQSGLDKALAGVPELNADAHKTLQNINNLSAQASKGLAHIDELTTDLKQLSHEVSRLSLKASQLADQGGDAGELITQTTLPKVNRLLTDLQATTQQIKRVASMLEHNPQELLLGPTERDVGPGEPGFKEKP